MILDFETGPIAQIKDILLEVMEVWWKINLFSIWTFLDFYVDIQITW